MKIAQSLLSFRRRLSEPPSRRTGAPSAVRPDLAGGPVTQPPGAAAVPAHRGTSWWRLLFLRGFGSVQLATPAGSPAAMRGLSLIEIGVVMVLVSLIVTGIYARATAIGEDVRIRRAVDEVLLLMTKAANYRTSTGDYASISITKLNSDGYSTDPITTGTKQNPWGADYALKPVSNNNSQVLLEITTVDDGACTRLAEALDGLVLNQESVGCASKKVSVQAR